jgi:UPF0271 protein
MRATLLAAKENGVATGAHPAYPDRDGFGRRARFLAGAALRDALVVQMRALTAIAKEVGVTISHVKPHGALYNDAAIDADLAARVAAAVQVLPGPPALVGPPGSALETAAADHGLAFIAEAFADRAYGADGHLVPRSRPGAVHEDNATIAAQAIDLALRGQVQSISGTTLSVPAQTLCVHGDTPDADRAAAAIRAALESNGIEIRAVV